MIVSCSFLQDAKRYLAESELCPAVRSTDCLAARERRYDRGVGTLRISADGRRIGNGSDRECTVFADPRIPNLLAASWRFSGPAGPQKDADICGCRPVCSVGIVSICQRNMAGLPA